MWPDPTVSALLAKGASPIRLGASLAGMLLGGGAFTALSVPAMARFVLPPPRDTRLADHLPFDRLLPDNRTLVCRDGTLVQCVIVEGRDITFLSAGERDGLFRLRKNWLDAMAELGVTLRAMLIREKVAHERADEFDSPVSRGASKPSPTAALPCCCRIRAIRSACASSPPVWPSWIGACAVKV